MPGTGNPAQPAALCKRAVTGPGCGSIFIPTNGTYTKVKGYVTMYQFGTPDAFNAGGANVYPYTLDGLSIWSGTDLIWAYGVTYWNPNPINGPQYAPAYYCPQDGGTKPGWTGYNGKWACASGNPGVENLQSEGGMVFFNTPLFGERSPIGGYVAGLMDLPALHNTAVTRTADIEIRMCVDQSYDNEDVFLLAAKISVL